VEKRTRSGSETRQRTERLDLRLLPSERKALGVLADQATAAFRRGFWRLLGHI
jgi:hypothetical protein